MAWVDYKKAHEMVLHCWIIESLKMAQVAENIITFLRKSKVNWKTELTYMILDEVSFKETACPPLSSLFAWYP